MSTIIFNTEKLTIFLLAVVFIFSLTILYVLLEYISMKQYVKRAISHEKLSMEIIKVKTLFTREKKAIEQYPTLYSYVQGIDSLFSNYLLDFRKAKIIRYDRPKEEMKKFREEYRAASTRIQELVQRYSELLKSIYRTNHPIRFLLDNFQINVKIYYTLFRLVIDIIVSSRLRWLISFTFSQQRKRLEYEKTLQSITENSEIKIAENIEMNCAA